MLCFPKCFRAWDDPSGEIYMCAICLKCEHLCNGHGKRYNPRRHSIRLEHSLRASTPKGDVPEQFRGL